MVDSTRQSTLLSGACSEAVAATAAARKTDAELLAEYMRSCDAGVFRAIIERHASKVYTVCLRILHDPHSAEDAAQAVFILLDAKAKKMRGGTILSGWLYQTADNIAHEARRRDATRRHHEREAADIRNKAYTPDTESKDTLRAQIGAALALLPAKQRDAIVLRYFDGRSESEIALELGCAVGTVGSRISRGLSALRHTLTQRNMTVASTFIAALLPDLAMHAPPLHFTDTVLATSSGKVAISTRVLTLLNAADRTSSLLKVNLLVATTACLVAIAAGIPLIPTGKKYSGSPSAPEIQRPVIGWEQLLDGVTTAHFIHDDCIYLSIHSGLAQHVEARRTSDGSLLWKSNTAGTVASLLDHLIVADGRTVIGLDRHTGIERWRYQIGWGGDASSLSPLAFDADSVFALATQNDTATARLLCVNATSGKTRWTVPVSIQPTEKVTRAPICGEHYVFVPIENRIICIAKRTQKVHASKEFSTALNSAVCSRDSLIIAAQGLSALSFQGSESWRIMGASNFSIPVVSDEILYAALARESADHRFLAVQTKNGSVLWECPTAGNISGQARVTAESVYVSCNDDHLYCINRADGVIRWKLPVSLQGWAPTPLTAEGCIFLCFQNKILCIRGE